MTVGTQTQPFGKLLDYEQFIDHQLQRTRRKRIQFTDIATACLTLLVAFLGVLFLEVVFDHLFGMPFWLRWFILMFGMAAIGGVYRLPAGGAPGPPDQRALRRQDDRGVRAGVQEQPDQLPRAQRRAERLPKAVLATLESRAVNDLTQVDVDARVNQRRMMQMIYALSARGGRLLRSTGSPRPQTRSTRSAARSSPTSPGPTNTQLLNIKPGDDSDLSEIVAGMHVNFEVDVQGIRPEKVLLHHSSDGGKFFAIKELAPGKNLYDPWQYTMPNVQQSHGLLPHGRRRRVAPLPPGSQARPDDRRDPPRPGFPRLRQDRARARTIEGGEIEAIEGTKVTVHAQDQHAGRLATINFASREIDPARGNGGLQKDDAPS